MKEESYINYTRCHEKLFPDISLERDFHILQKASLDGFKTLSPSYSSGCFNMVDEGHSMLSMLIL